MLAPFRAPPRSLPARALKGTFGLSSAALLCADGAGVWGLRHRRATSWIGPVALWSLVGVSTLVWITSPWSAPPPTPRALAWFALVGWIVPFWAALADRHYTARESR